MRIVKMIAAILLAVYLFFSAAFNLFSYQPTGAVAFFLGLCAVIDGVLILISHERWLHYVDDKK